MPAGFECYNNGDVLQITSDYRNYLLKQIVTPVPELSATFPNNGWIFTVTTTGILPVVAVQSSAYICISSKTISGSTTTFKFIVPIFSYSGGTPEAKFFVFEVAPPTPSATYGLEVYTQDGQLAFSSDAKFMKVKAQFQGEDYSTLPIGELYTGVGSLAFVFGDASGEYQLTTTSPGGQLHEVEQKVYCPVLRNTATGIAWDESEVGYYFYETEGPPLGTIFSVREYGWIVIDVTNF